MLQTYILNVYLLFVRITIVYTVVISVVSVVETYLGAEYLVEVWIR